MCSRRLCHILWSLWKQHDALLLSMPFFNHLIPLQLSPLQRNLAWYFAHSVGSVAHADIITMLYNSFQNAFTRNIRQVWLMCIFCWFLFVANWLQWLRFGFLEGTHSSFWMKTKKTNRHDNWHTRLHLNTDSFRFYQPVFWTMYIIQFYTW